MEVGVSRTYAKQHDEDGEKSYTRVGTVREGLGAGLCPKNQNSLEYHMARVMATYKVHKVSPLCCTSRRRDRPRPPLDGPGPASLPSPPPDETPLRVPIRAIPGPLRV